MPVKTKSKEKEYNIKQSTMEKYVSILLLKY